MDREQFKPAIACIYGGGEMMQKFTQLGIPTFNLDSPHQISPRTLLRAYRLIRNFAPHIVHTYLLRADLYGAFAARLAGVPTILTTGCAIGPYRREKTRKTDKLLDLICRLSATDALAVSNAVRNDMIKHLHWPPNRVTAIHTGITFKHNLSDNSAQKSIRQQLQIPESVPLVLTIARLSYEKGINVLVQAAAVVHRQMPSVHFAVAGNGPMENNLRTQIRTAGLDQVVHLPGFQKNIDKILAAADLFVLPSLMEGMPIAILEAYAAEKPVIATAVGGSVEAVEHNHSGLLVPPNDADSMASAIVRCLSDESLRNRLARDGRSWAEKRFSVDVVAQKYETLYERLYRDRTSKKNSLITRSNLGDSVANTI
ncbi:MAG: glycosyltransferase [Planctomycetota bacterium]|nr:MAG: glycosyltransferase [Planctomycetota bacterium]